MNRRTFISASALATGGLALASTGNILAGGGFSQENNSKKKKKKHTRKLGKLEVSAIGFGLLPAVNFYGGAKKDKNEMIKIIRTAHENGVDFFDTAEVYGNNYLGEKILGEALKPIRNQAIIATKFGFDVKPEGGHNGVKSDPEHIRKVVDQMLVRLQTDRIDLLYQHRVDPNVPIEDVAGVVKELVRQGKVLHWGLSEAGLGTIRRAHKELPLAAIQDEYSLWVRDYEQTSIALCEELGIGFVPWCPLAHGFLAGAIDENSRFSEGDFRATLPRLTPENLPQNMKLVTFIKEWALRKNATPAQISLAWLLAQKPFIVPIPGTSQMVHLKDNIRANDVRFSSSEMKEFNAELSKIKIVGNRSNDVVMAEMGLEAPLKK